MKMTRFQKNSKFEIGESISMGCNPSGNHLVHSEPKQKLFLKYFITVIPSMSHHIWHDTALKVDKNIDKRQRAVAAKTNAEIYTVYS